MADDKSALREYKYLLLAAIIPILFFRSWRKRQAERQLAADHGCKPLKPWKSSWPLGLDLLVKAFRYNRQDRIMQFFLSVVEESGSTFEQNLFGVRGIDTIDPENIETVLSKKFDGSARLVFVCVVTDVFRFQPWIASSNFLSFDG